MVDLDTSRRELPIDASLGVCTFPIVRKIRLEIRLGCVTMREEQRSAAHVLLSTFALESQSNSFGSVAVKTTEVTIVNTKHVPWYLVCTPAGSTSSSEGISGFYIPVCENSFDPMYHVRFLSPSCYYQSQLTYQVPGMAHGRLLNPLPLRFVPCVFNHNETSAVSAL